MGSVVIRNGLENEMALTATQTTGGRALPQFVLEILATRFSPAEISIVDQNWNRYSQMSFSNSCADEFLLQGDIILMLERT
jgi:hypothetical protein